MRRKHNPYLALATLLLLALIVTWICGGCSKEICPAPYYMIEPGRFTLEESFRSGPYRGCVLTDTETGVQYLFIRNGGGIAMTKLEGIDETGTTEGG
jgi:hypothetical protein